MYTTLVMSSELENRFDVQYYNPKALELIRKMKEKAKETGYEIRELNTFGGTKKGIFEIPASVYEQTGIPFIRVSCIKYLTVDVNDLTYLSKDWHEKEQKTEVVPGDIVISKSGTIGNVAIISPWLGNSNISQDIIGFYVNNKRYSGFLALYLSSKLGKIQMEKIKTQQNQAHLTLTPFRKLKILINEDIVEKVSILMNEAMNLENDFFENFNKAKNELRNYLNIETVDDKYLTFKISSKELNSKFIPKFYYPPYLQTNYLLNSKFKTKKLGKISKKIIKGSEVGSKNYKKAGIPFIRTSDFVNGTIDRDSYHKISEKIYDEFMQDLQPNDILFTNDGKIGLSAFFIEGDKCIIQSHIRIIRVVDKDFTPEYILTFLNMELGLCQVYRRIFIQSTISTIENGLQDIDIPYIDKDVMFKITNYCKKAFEAKKRRNQLIDESNLIIESMIF